MNVPSSVAFRLGFSLNSRESLICPKNLIDTCVASLPALLNNVAIGVDAGVVLTAVPVALPSTVTEGVPPL